MYAKLLSLTVLSSSLLFLTACQEEPGTLEIISEPPTDVISSIPTSPPAAPSISCGSTAILQSQTTVNGADVFNGGSDYDSLGQTITLNSTTTLKSIDLHLNATHASITATLNIYPYSGSGNPDLNGISLGQATVTDFTNYIGFSKRGWVNFELDNITVLPAGQYYLDLSTDANEGSSENIYVWGDGLVGSDPYVNGKSHRLNSYGFWYSYNSDRAFKLNECQ